MTLVFVGAVTQEQLDRLLAIGGLIQGGAFAMNIDRLGYWPHNRIAWAGCSEMPSCQRRLYDSLSANLHGQGFQLEKRPFVPHITLARKARCGDLPILEQPIRWSAAEFALVESLPQPAERQYLSLASWPLRTAVDKKICKEC